MGLDLIVSELPQNVCHSCLEKLDSIQTESQSIQTESQSIQTESQSIHTESQSIHTESQSIHTELQSIHTESSQSIHTESHPTLFPISSPPGRSCTVHLRYANHSRMPHICNGTKVDRTRPPVSVPWTIQDQDTSRYKPATAWKSGCSIDIPKQRGITNAKSESASKPVWFTCSIVLYKLNMVSMLDESNTPFASNPLVRLASSDMVALVLVLAYLRYGRRLSMLPIMASSRMARSMAS
ncbi:hypothetical protein B566_EDAN013684 [Ephemera danica]|nr:hypothetical protein B566_EDAN013684 [Ephemera danica]